MRKAFSAVTRCLLVLGVSLASGAESTWEFAVQVSAAVQASPPQISLSWRQDTTSQPTSYMVSRKEISASTWGPAVMLPGTATTYVDPNVQVGVPYEYQVVKTTDGYTGYGYLSAGIHVPLVENRGRMLLVLDNTHAAALALEVQRLRADLAGDGWSVTTLLVSRNDTPQHVKALIQAQYQADTEKVKAVLLLGRVPVPYSGDLVPDGHLPDHRGAWPADAYYGDMEGTWTDTTVNVSSAADARNRNVPGDGKFDQSSLPGTVKLMVGRVDLANLPGRLTWGGAPTFPSEVELLRNYLNKNHNYRHKRFDVPRRAAIGDFFGTRNGEAFAASAWRSFAPLFGPENIRVVTTPGEWAPSLSQTPTLFAYGCGAGSYSSIAGLGNSNPYKDVITTELVGHDIKSVFALLFGSWLGDWDSEDNILRAVLALPSYGLASAWSGRPHWFLHHMAMGHPIGYSARLTQNNGPSGPYRNQVNSCAGLIHVALMGDPSLRLHTVSPVSDLEANASGGKVWFQWTGSPDANLGYAVYSAPTMDGPFTRLTDVPTSATSFAAPEPSTPTVFMVKAVRLESGPSGTYENSSQGVTVSWTANTAGTGGTPISETSTSTGSATNGVPPISDGQTSPVPASTIPRVSEIDQMTPVIPRVGANTLSVLTPLLLELARVTTKPSAHEGLSAWDLVDPASGFKTPSPGAIRVEVDGQPVTVTSIGFKRRPLYAPIAKWDLRIGNYLYIALGTALRDNQQVVVKNPDGTLWDSSSDFSATSNPHRYSPVIHVNQEGYVPNLPKVAMVGYYAGSLGEVEIPAANGFRIIDANTGATVHQGSLTVRRDQGYTYSPAPYQKVYEADFSSLEAPGEYRLLVPGLGASMPFLINEGVAMSFARAYALGLYHQRCGTDLNMPFTRFSHDACHHAAASVPVNESAFQFTWSTIGSFASIINQNNPPQIAPALSSPGAQRFPFVRQGTVDVSGGHHDAGDYSKYTINTASMIHYLMFAVDSLPGVASLDNLGIPESGDGISDLLQEAKWESDFLMKMQDTDGGFYFLVYPQNRKYESDVPPERGDPQVVWPKTTSVTAAAVAALAQCASSPAFRQAYPQAAAAYLARATAGWNFLLRAISTYGKNGSYQKITHYGDDFAHNDELAWAAAEMYLATGDPAIHARLLEWLDPADPATMRWGWWRMCQGYGNAIRSYAFAARSGRFASTGGLDPVLLGKCEAQTLAAGDDLLRFSRQNAYGSSFPVQTKAMKAAGWYFSTDQAYDLAVAYQLDPRPDFMGALLANLNYEAGCNPVNVSYVTGLGWKRPRDIVSQWAVNDARQLPPSGIPVGNICGSFGYLWHYQGLLQALCFPSDSSTVAPYPFYDRWADSWNVSAEMVVLNQARSLGTAAFLAARTTTRTQQWRPVPGQIEAPSSVVPVGSSVTLKFFAPGFDLQGARITWEGRDQDPAYGDEFTFTPQNNGSQWVEAEAQLPDGRRIFAVTNFLANAPDLRWTDEALPVGAVAGADGGDAWTWVTSPSPVSGNLVHESAAGSGVHQHFFHGASTRLEIESGDQLYAYVYLDPANPPQSLMLQWHDGRSWEHRAYWGQNVLPYGTDGTPGRRYMGPLPATGRWVQLKVPAAVVALEGQTISGMAFTLFGGRAWWDVAGRLSATSGSGATVTVSSEGEASRVSMAPGNFTFTRTGLTHESLTLRYTLNGSAVPGQDYTSEPSLIIPAGARSAVLKVTPLPAQEIAPTKSLTLRLQATQQYSMGSTSEATIIVAGNTVKTRLSMLPSGPTLSWASTSNRVYRIARKATPTGTNWVTVATVKASGAQTSWTDTTAGPDAQRYYIVAQTE